jgi:hypothetical protein
LPTTRVYGEECIPSMRFNVKKKSGGMERIQEGLLLLMDLEIN